MRAQSAIEFLSTYAWAFIIVALFIATITLLVTIKNPQEYSPSSCYITPELLCSQSVFYTNMTASTFGIVFSNNLGTPLYLPNNAFTVYLPYTSYSYTGTCLPSSLPKGGTATCMAKIKNAYSIGVQINPYFKIQYSVCSGKSCQTFNTTGTSSDIVFYSKSIFSNLLLLTSTGTGNVILNGVVYPSNSVVPLINNIKYNIYAQPPNGYTFNSWIPSNAVLGSTALQSTTVYLTQNGSVEAAFTPS
ncbi:MAG: InlB B-repeat-containing protein [Candidatus Micrarchaeia archaeon]